MHSWSESETQNKMNHIKIIEFKEDNSELTAGLVFTDRDIQHKRHGFRKNAIRRKNKAREDFGSPEF